MTGENGVETQCKSDNPNMLVRPPLLYVVSIVMGAGLHAILPWSWLSPAVGASVTLPLVLAAAVLFTMAIRELRRARTGIRAHQPSTAVVASGPYRFSRNPIYLAMTLLHLGLAAWVNSAWLLLTLAGTLVVMTYGVIKREERYLTRKFGERYLSYQRSVRRWL